MAEDRLWTRDFLLADFTGFLVFGSFYYLMSTLQYYVIGLGGNVAAVGLVQGVFVIVAVLLRPMVGNLLDNRGRRRFLLLGIAIIVGSFLVYPMVPQVWWILAVRMLHGVGWAFATTAVSTMVADVVPPRRRGEAMGYYSNFMDVAMGAGPFIGVLLLQFGGYQAVFIGAAITLLPALGTVGAIKECYQPPPAPVKRPLLSRPALLPGLVMITASIGYGTVVTFIPTLATARHIAGTFLGVSDYAFFYIAYAATLILTRGPWGRISDRYGRQAAIIPGLLLMAAGTFTLALTRSFPILVMAGIIYAGGFGSAQPAIMAWTVDRAGRSNFGAAMGTFFAAFDGGIGIGAMAMGTLIQHFSYSLAFDIASVLSLIGFSIYLADRTGRLTGSGVNSKPAVS
ncbi:MAG TPA: MFS transporter [Spirochaetia bacterium]|nr:MFS transporter [Spirochaetia bacterium]